MQKVLVLIRAHKFAKAEEYYESCRHFTKIVIR